MITISAEQDYKHTFKILILGDAAVGKSSLVTRFVHGKFEKNYMVTIGMEPYTRYETIEGQKICYSLWDIAGEAKFQAMRKMFYAGSAGSIITFDLTRKDSYEHVDVWAGEAKNEATNQHLILVGNKNDLGDARQVTTEEGEAKAKELGCISYIETSALTGDMVEDAFNSLGKALLKKYSA